jgi:hypothetical protein
MVARLLTLRGVWGDVVARMPALAVLATPIAGAPPGSPQIVKARPQVITDSVLETAAWRGHGAASSGDRCGQYARFMG